MAGEAMILLMALLGGFLYRWRGHASRFKRYFPRPLSQALFALPYAVIAWPMGWAIGLITWGLSTAGVLTGHGRGISLSDPNLIGKPETLEFLVRWMRLPVYWHKVALLSVTGLSITAAAGIFTLNPVIALSGLLKGPAYMAGFWIYDISPKAIKWFTNEQGEIVYYDGVRFLPHHLDTGPEIGEFLTGAALWGALAI